MSNSTTPAHGQLVVICTMSCKEALIELVPVFERERGVTVDITYGAGPDLAKRIRSGMRGDIFVGPEEFSGPLIDEGFLIGGSRTAFAHSGAVLAVKAGAAKPDLSTPQKLKEALLAAKAVCYSGGASGIHFVQACQRLGIEDIVAAKLVRPRPGEMVGPVLVRGEADIGVQQPAELLPVPGIEIIGPLPPELRQTIVYGATVFTGSTQSDGNQAFVDFMRSHAARDVLRETGLDPV
ncbi:MAG: ABC transporter substrate-binding protein [Betaproteobacteria bacterium]|nr:MAG: ABC transporter substrate-binding protein [Betaproteobacteria bacterium]